MGGVFKCNKSKILKVMQRQMWRCTIYGPGNLTGLIIGSSFAMNIMGAVAANPIFKEVTLAWANGLSFPAADERERFFIDKLVVPIKPDILYVVQRYFQPYMYKTSKADLKLNQEFQRWNSVFSILQNYTSAIVVNKEQVMFKLDVSQDYIRRKQQNLPLLTKTATQVGLLPF